MVSGRYISFERPATWAQSILLCELGTASNAACEAGERVGETSACAKWGSNVAPITAAPNASRKSLRENLCGGCLQPLNIEQNLNRCALIPGYGWTIHRRTLVHGGRTRLQDR